MLNPKRFGFTIYSNVSTVSTRSMKENISLLKACCCFFFFFFFFFFCKAGILCDVVSTVQH